MTTSRRLTLLAFVFFAWTPAAYAWSRPVEGPVLQPFTYDEAHPYAAGQHRGIDIGADAAGETVVAPAAGTVSFAGTVPTNGKSVTIQTGDGYSVTLTHLGSIAVAKGATVAEQDAVGTIGPSGTPEVDGPYVHLGIRVTADPNGYIDPLSLLPPAPESSGTQSDSPPAQSSSSRSAAAPPVKKTSRPSAPARPQVAGGVAATASGQRTSVREHPRAQESGMRARSGRSTHRSRARDTRPPLEIATDRPNERSVSLRRPFDEPAAVTSPIRDTGDAIRTAAPSAHVRPETTDRLIGLACNGAAALIALGAALAANRRRRRRRAIPVAVAQVLHLAPPVLARRDVSRAA